MFLRHKDPEREKYPDNGPWLPPGPRLASEEGAITKGNSGRLCDKRCQGVAQSLDPALWKPSHDTARVPSRQQGQQATKANRQGERSGPSVSTAGHGCFRSQSEAPLGYPKKQERGNFSFLRKVRGPTTVGANTNRHLDFMYLCSKH